VPPFWQPPLAGAKHQSTPLLLLLAVDGLTTVVSLAVQLLPSANGEDVTSELPAMPPHDKPVGIRKMNKVPLRRHASLSGD
jgi:hypothetical protein